MIALLLYNTVLIRKLELLLLADSNYVYFVNNLLIHCIDEENVFLVPLCYISVHGYTHIRKLDAAVI